MPQLCVVASDRAELPQPVAQAAHDDQAVTWPLYTRADQHNSSECNVNDDAKFRDAHLFKGGDSHGALLCGGQVKGRLRHLDLAVHLVRLEVGLDAHRAKARIDSRKRVQGRTVKVVALEESVGESWWALGQHTRRVRTHNCRLINDTLSSNAPARTTSPLSSMELCLMLRLQEKGGRGSSGCQRRPSECTRRAPHTRAHLRSATARRMATSHALAPSSPILLPSRLISSNGLPLTSNDARA